jgi:hypothetical protein
MDAVGVSVPIELVPFPEGWQESQRSVPDITKVGAQVGWLPTRDLDTIVRDVAGEYGDRPLGFVLR